MKKDELLKISLLQAFGLVGYCIFMGWFIFYGAEQLFGNMNDTFGPTLFLMIFVISILICALIVAAYPISLFLETKDGKDSVKIVLFTTGWLLLLVLIGGVVMSLV